jgi:hypothetical protein
MGHIIDRELTTGAAGSTLNVNARPPRLVAAIVALGLLIGGVGGWSAFALLEPARAHEPSLSVEQAKWEADAKEACEDAVAQARQDDMARRRWEAQADHYAPGWRE